MTSRKKTICLSEGEYQALVRARGKHEYTTGKKSAGFGEFVAFLGGLYLIDQLTKGETQKPKLKTLGLKTRKKKIMGLTR
jgi:hypothetical protein